MQDGDVALFRFKRLIFFVFSCSFSFCERKRTKRKLKEPAWAVPLRPPVSGACLPRQKYFAGLFFPFFFFL